MSFPRNPVLPCKEKSNFESFWLRTCEKLRKVIIKSPAGSLRTDGETKTYTHNATTFNNKITQDTKDNWPNSEGVGLTFKGDGSTRRKGDVIAKKLKTS
jgi:hypothetical protein